MSAEYRQRFPLQIASLMVLHELPAPLSNMGELLRNLCLQIPREYEHVIWAYLVQFFGRIDGDMCARQELSVLIRISIDDELEQVLTDFAIVQKRIAFSGRPVADNSFCIAAGSSEKVD